MATLAPLWCPDCRAIHRGRHKKQRGYADERARLQILREWKTIYGDICPGYLWCTTPNEPNTTTDLTVDHTRAQRKGGTLTDGYTIMCRTANSRKK